MSTATILSVERNVNSYGVASNRNIKKITDDFMSSNNIVVNPQNNEVLSAIISQIILRFGASIKLSDINFSIITPNLSDERVNQRITILKSINKKDPKLVKADIPKTSVYVCIGRESTLVDYFTPTYN